MTHTETEALKLAYEALEFDGFYGTQKQRAITAIKQALAAPTVQEPVGEVIGTNEYAGFGQIKHVKTIQWRGEPAPIGTKLYTTPPAQPAPVLEGRDWSLLEATQESLREHMAEIKRLKEAQPAVPDAMTSADIQEHIEYVAGWNDCRQAMMEMMK